MATDLQMVTLLFYHPLAWNLWKPHCCWRGTFRIPGVIQRDLWSPLDNHLSMGYSSTSSQAYMQHRPWPASQHGL
jgi:hypothetical protein